MEKFKEIQLPIEVPLDPSRKSTVPKRTKELTYYVEMDSLKDFEVK